MIRKIKNNELNRLTTDEFKLVEKIPFILILEDIRSLNNVGSLFRTADSFLLERLILAGITGTPPNREIHKSALGAELSMEWEHHYDIVEIILNLKENNYQIWALEQAEGSLSLENFKLNENSKIALILGNEVDGVSEKALENCDGVIEIPQFGTKHSLNVSVSAGIAVWHIAMQMHKKTRE